MGTVIRIPCNFRTVRAVRQEVDLMARRFGRNDDARRHAFASAMRELSTGASSAWAIQKARQELRDVQLRLCGTTGPEAA